MDLKRVAALSGVLLYLREQKESEQEAIDRGAGPWALFGRKSIMEMRSLVQRRSGRRL